MRSLEIQYVEYEWSIEGSQLFGSCMAACAAAGQLEALQVSSLAELVVSTWIAALTRLQRLDLAACDGNLQLTASLHPLTALRKLRLSAGTDGGCSYRQTRGCRQALRSWNWRTGELSSCPSRQAANEGPGGWG